ncbi:MAG: DNA gyrase subunit A [Phycisphaeraceae bacterium]|nr:DNA gyrase subunit A [Phycisphaeraceae bacterium]MCW5761958.1 DNA gyrase subunit A [Phycisphaeraceae bacterium]
MAEHDVTDPQAADTPPPGDIDGNGTSAGSSGAGGGGHIVDHDIERELQDSYLTYAMSTIMDRALPDVRDGLKPSQRRILVAMNDLNLRPGKKQIKCAKITGDTSGNYHPHGDMVIYPTLVGMAQRWKMRVPLIDPQGNFGSIDGDPPAAQRYTEARMHHAAVDLLADLKLDTVDFQPNYDDRLTEPTVLPGKFPNLLINGGMGIAVGMATSLPPHNPSEIFDAIVRVVDNPQISLLELMTDEVGSDGVIVRQGVKGPDFPTGGTMLGRRGILEAYDSGRGRVTVRGTCHIEEMAHGREQIVIDEIPFGVVQDNLVEEIVNAVKEERLKDISDVRNESGRNAQTRIVLELKRGADARVVENQIFQHTQLQQTFSIINVALVNRQPRTMGLKQLIECYIEHRTEVIRRRTAHLLREAKKKAHILEGMIYAVIDIDEIIALIKSSQTREEAITKLMARRYRIPPGHPAAAMLPARLIEAVRKAEEFGGVKLSRVQAETIGSMRLIQLVGLEIERLVREYNELTVEIEDYERILADPQRVREIIKADCAEMKARYGSPRLTAIEEAEGDISIESLIQVEDVVVTISHLGYAKRLPASTYQAQGRGGKGIRASDSRDGDFVEHLFVASTHDDLLCFTDTGRVFKLKVYELPELSRTSKGRPIINYIELREGERACTYLAIKNFEASSHYLTFVSRGGIVKRTPLKAYSNVNRSGLIAVGLKEGDALLNVMLTTGSDDLILVTAEGMAIRFSEDDVRDMGRSAAGVKGIDLEDGNQVIGAVRVPMEPDKDGDLMTAAESMARNRCLLTITQNGYGKRTPVDEYRVAPEVGKMRSQSRGGKGRSDIRISDRNGPAIVALSVEQGDDIVVITRGGQLVRTAADTIRETGRGAQGVKVVSLNEGDSVVSAARVMDSVDAAVSSESSEATPDADD